MFVVCFSSQYFSQRTGQYWLRSYRRFATYDEAQDYARLMPDERGYSTDVFHSSDRTNLLSWWMDGC